MIAYLSKVLPQFVLPAGLTAILLFLALFLIAEAQGCFLAWYLSASSLSAHARQCVFSQLSSRVVGMRYMPPAAEIKADAIVLLGGGTEAADTPVRWWK
jgi:hypothetical protein